MVDAFPLAQSSQYFPLFVEPLRRDDQRDALADSLLGGITEEPFGA
jgi:hypothetical protein